MTSITENEFGGAWTQNKLKILQGYLNSYTTALKAQLFKLTYVDAFAGTGYINPNLPGGRQAEPVWGAELDEPAKEMLKGSTLLALEVVDKPFDRFLFVEQNGAFVQALEALKQKFSDRDIQIWRGDANQVLQLWCELQNELWGGTPWNCERAVIFLDPFATEVEWNTIAGIADTKSVDLWILFPVSALTRNMPTLRQPHAGYAAMLDRVYGGSEWRRLYQIRNEPTVRQMELLVSEVAPLEVVRDDQQAVVQVYLDKLRSIFPTVAPSPKWFCNSRNSPLFALMFASANPGRGGKIALNIADHLLKHW